MSFSDAFEQNILDHYFIGAADNAAFTGATIWVSLCTADPGETGTAVTNEATYTGYGRASITKATGLSRTGSTVSNVATVSWPACTGGTNTITHFALVSSASGAGTIYAKGAFTASLAVSTGITPQSSAGVLTVSLD